MPATAVRPLTWSGTRPGSGGPATRILHGGPPGSDQQAWLSGPVRARLDTARAQLGVKVTSEEPPGRDSTVVPA